eukprot:11228358-Lingulodinium_polyedra.AAC.4
MEECYVYTKRGINECHPITNVCRSCNPRWISWPRVDIDAKSHRLLPQPILGSGDCFHAASGHVAECCCVGCAKQHGTLSLTTRDETHVATLYC